MWLVWAFLKAADILKWVVVRKGMCCTTLYCSTLARSDSSNTSVGNWGTSLFLFASFFNWILGGTDCAASCNEIVQLEAGHLPFLQQLVNSTYSNVWTRDRRKHHPETWYKQCIDTHGHAFRFLSTLMVQHMLAARHYQRLPGIARHCYTHKCHKDSTRAAAH